MGPHLNPIEHVWNMLGRRETPVQNLRQLEAVLHREWLQFPATDWRVRRRIEAVI